MPTNRIEYAPVRKTLMKANNDINMLDSMVILISRIGSLEKKAAAKGAPIRLILDTNVIEELIGEENRKPPAFISL